MECVSSLETQQVKCTCAKVAASNETRCPSCCLLEAACAWPSHQCCSNLISVLLFPPPATTTSSRSTLTPVVAVRTTSATSGSLAGSVGWPSTTGSSLMVSAGLYWVQAEVVMRGGSHQTRNR